jgi:hypothetical protein
MLDRHCTSELYPCSGGFTVAFAGGRSQRLQPEVGGDAERWTNSTDSTRHQYGRSILPLVNFCAIYIYALYIYAYIYIYTIYIYMYDWSLNSELQGCNAGVLLLKPHLHPILFWLFCRWGSQELFAQGGLEPGFV